MYYNLALATTGLVWFMVFNSTFNNISVISWSVSFIDRENHDLSQVTDKLYHIMLIVSSTTRLSGVRTHKVGGDRH
jgi:hypothetical protein